MKCLAGSKWRPLVLCVALCLLATGIWFAITQPPKPYKMGFMAVLSGPGADLGVSGRNGVILAVEEHNAAGGIHGQPIELLVRDTRRDADLSQLILRGFISDKIEVIIGPMTSGTAMALMPIINASNSILLSPTVTTTDLTGKDDNFLRVIDDTRTYAQKSARYQYQKMGHRTYSVIYDISNKSYTESWTRDFKAEFEKLGGRMLQAQTYVPGQGKSFMDIAAEQLKSNPDIVLVIGTAVDAALICQQLRKLNPAQHIVLSEWPSTERFIELAGQSAEGVMAAQFIDRNDESMRFQSFLRAYKARFGQTPGFAGLAGYDAAQVALRALMLRKPGDSLKKTILDTGSFEGAQSTFPIDHFGDAKRNTFTTVIRTGQFVTLE